MLQRGGCATLRVQVDEERVSSQHGEMNCQRGFAGAALLREEAVLLHRRDRRTRLPHAEWLGLLLDRETTDRHDRRLRARLRYARLRHQAVVEDVDYVNPQMAGRQMTRRSMLPMRCPDGKCSSDRA